MDEKFKVYDAVTGAAAQWIISYLTEKNMDAVIT